MRTLEAIVCEDSECAGSMGVGGCCGGAVSGWRGQEAGALERDEAGWGRSGGDQGRRRKERNSGGSRAAGAIGGGRARSVRGLVVVVGVGGGGAFAWTGRGRVSGVWGG